MFYEPKDGHGLSKNPFNSLVVARSISWIDIAKLHPIGRMGYQDYTQVTGETVFATERPRFRE
jgi:hypothetical protein